MDKTKARAFDAALTDIGEWVIKHCENAKSGGTLSVDDMSKILYLMILGMGADFEPTKIRDLFSKE